MFISFISLWFLFTLVPAGLAGQLFTTGIGIINAPSAGSPGHAGSTLPISVDVSGNGALSPDSANPQSILPTHIASIEIYLVSSQTGLNLTVSSGPTFLTGETGTVRHLSWPVPSCVPPGQYNLTFYERAQFNGQHIFTITPISIPIENPNVSGRCTEGVNSLQSQPQPSTTLGQSPFLRNGDATGTRITTSVSPTLLTITLPGGFDLPTVTQTIVAPTTVVIVSKEILTTTFTGLEGTVTSVVTATRTETSVIAQVNNSGFIPANSASISCIHPIGSLIALAVITLLSGTL